MADLSHDAQTAWRKRSKRAKAAEAAARRVAEALDAVYRSPSEATQKALAEARAEYDQAEHEVSRADLEAERLTDQPDHRWSEIRATRDLGRGALAAVPAEALAAAKAARQAADALADVDPPRGHAGPIVRRAVASAREFALAAANRAIVRATRWPVPVEAPRPVDPRAEHEAALARADEAARACVEAVAEARVLARRATAFWFEAPRPDQLCDRCDELKPCRCDPNWTPAGGGAGPLTVNGEPIEVTDIIANVSDVDTTTGGAS